MAAFLLIDPSLITDVIGLMLVAFARALQKLRRPDPVAVSATS